MDESVYLMCSLSSVLAGDHKKNHLGGYKSFKIKAPLKGRESLLAGLMSWAPHPGFTLLSFPNFPCKKLETTGFQSLNFPTSQVKRKGRHRKTVLIF